MNFSIMQSMANQACDITDNNFIGIFLYGSQNYKLDCEDSDMDAILLVYSADKPKSEINLEIGKIKIYTLKYFIYRLKQGDLECCEILYTKHRIINPMYASCIENFVEEFSNCMSYERIKHSFYNKLDEHLYHVLWMIKNKENARYNKKRLYWAIRVCNQLQRINDGESFESSLVYRPSNEYDLIKIKTITNYLSLKEFNEIYRCLVKFIRSLPRYSKEVSNNEEKCLANFYVSMTKFQI